MRKALVLAAALSLSAGTAMAIPYASQIRLSNTSPSLGSSTTISYQLNQAADTVLIEVLDDANTVLASFDGTAAQGANSVLWDLTVDNDGGAAVDDGTDYRVRITANADRPEEWTWFAANQGEFNADYAIEDTYWNEGDLEPLNPRSLFHRFRPHSVTVPKNPDLDIFGHILCPSSEQDWADHTRPHEAVIVLNPDLTPAAGSVDGFDTRTLRHPNDPDDGGFQDVWFASEDPVNPGHYFVSGQGGVTQLIYGDPLVDIVAFNANPDEVDLGAPRTHAVVGTDDTDRMIYLASGTSIINRGEVNEDNELVGPLVNILGIGGFYSKHVFFDSEGNLIWVARDDGSAGGGAVYRWLAAEVEAADAGTLTEANADWAFSAPGIDRLNEVAELPNGDIVLASTAGFHVLGNVTSTDLSGTIDPVDAFFPFPSEVVVSTYGTGLDVDPFGNIYYATIGTTAVPRQGFVVAGLSPGGNTSTEVTAPLSQTLTINPEPTSARMWHLYE